MLKDIQVKNSSISVATFAAGAAMKTGMAVQKNLTDQKAVFAESATTSNLFFVQKARYPSGINAAKTNFADKDANFNDIAIGERVVLNKYGKGDIFSTDAYGTTTKPRVGFTVAGGTDGNLAEVSGATTSIYKCIGHNDDGSISVEVLENGLANPSGAKAITAFTIDSVAGTIDTDDFTIAIELASGTDLTSLTPTITVSDNATVSPKSAVANDFTEPVAYTVTAQDGTTQVYVVTVTLAE